MIEEKENCGWNDLKQWVAYATNLTEHFVEENKKVIFLYGGGHACYWYIKFFTGRGISIQGIIESDPSKCGSELYGHHVYELDDVLRNYKEYSIVISAPKFLSEIINMLEQKCNKADIYSF